MSAKCQPEGPEADILLGVADILLLWLNISSRDFELTASPALQWCLGWNDGSRNVTKLHKVCTMLHDVA